jgi:hypothetical protein
MPEAAPVVPTPVVPKNGAAPKAPTQPIDPKPAEVKADEPTDSYVIDGKEVQLTRTQAKHWVEKSAASDKRFQEASKQRKEVEDLFKALDTDGLAVLEHKYGPEKVKGIIEKYLEKQAKREAMTPEQKRIQELEEAKAAADEKLKAADEEKRTEAQKRVDAQNQAALEQQLVGAAKKYSLPQDAVTLELMTDVAIEAIELGLEHVTADQVAQEVARRLDDAKSSRDQKRSKTLNGKALLDYLGAETVAEVLKASLESGVTSAADKAKAPAKTEEAPVKRNGKGFVSESDFERKFGLRR